MRFIGNKQNLVNFLFKPLENLNPKNLTFIDIFSGTSSVAQFFKNKGYRVISNDLLFFSFVLQKAYIENNENPLFDSLCRGSESNPLQLVLSKLNSLDPKTGFVYNNYTEVGSSLKSRNYFSPENASKIDSIREQLDIWKKDQEVTESEFYILLASLIEAVPYVSNIAGTYGAALKIDDPRKFKQIKLNKIKLLDNSKYNQVFNCEGIELLRQIEGDVLYVDPPYNVRQYPANYHLLEQIAIWDKEIRQETGTGLRNYDTKKSKFCKRKEVCGEFLRLVETAVSDTKVSHLLFSYNSEGLMNPNYIEEIMSSFGKIEVHRQKSRRFKSNSKVDSPNGVYELLFHLSVD